MPFCTYCGSQEPEGTNFCSSCGQSMIISPTITSNNSPLQQGTTVKIRKESGADIAASAAPVLIEVPPTTTHLPTDGRFAVQSPLPAAPGKKPLPLKPLLAHLPARVRLPGRWNLVLALIVLVGGGIWATLSLLAPSTYDRFVMKNGIQSGFDAQHSGFNPYESELSPATVATLVQAWTATTNRAIYSSPEVANGVIYAGSADGQLYAFRADGCGQPTCSPLWTAAIGLNFSSPIVASGVVYVGTYKGQLLAFKAGGCGRSTCSPLWAATIDGAIGSSPVVANGMVYVGSYNGKLYAFHRR